MTKRYTDEYRLGMQL